MFDSSGRPVASAQKELPQIFPKPGWVEHDPEEIWRATVEVCRGALAKAKLEAQALAGIGITNQRETTVVWDRATGKPVHNAIVWQDRRTADRCAELKRAGHEEEVAAKTGLLLDPYFSGTKIAWILDHVAGARAAAEKGALAAGTIESFLLWRLTGGKVHASDATNASRTLLLDIHKGAWDARPAASCWACRAALLPKVVDCSGEFGVATADILGAPVPILGMAGDQQAATVGQACIKPGMVKATYGTGCFALLNTGSIAVRSQQSPAHHHRLPARRPAHLRARRQHLRRRRRRAMAARRPAHDQDVVRGRGRRPRRPRPATASTWCRRSSALARPTGMPARAARCSGLTRDTGPGRDRRRHARFGLLPDPRPASRRCAATARRSTNCASTAAWW